jgi:stage III sporulation protein AB
MGAALLVGGCTACGLLGVARLRRRAHALETLLRAFSLLRGEICDRLAPMPEVLNRLSRECEYPANALYRNVYDRLPRLGDAGFPELWREAVAVTQELMLTPNESAELCELSSTLGRYNVDEQRDAIERAQRRFEEFARAASDARDRDGKLFSALGIAVGAIVVILLI